MALKLYAHPFSSYCWKVLIALYENATPFEFCLLGPGNEQVAAEHAARWPLRKMPVLADGERTVLEASIIIEYLDVHHRGAVRLIPQEVDAALEARMMDRCFDNYVMTPMQKCVGNALRVEADRDAYGVAEAHRALDAAYDWLNRTMTTRPWASGADFSLADCAAAPALFYADWVHPIDASLTALRAYRQRLLARPSVARVVDEARPYRAYFPLGAPDRD